MIQISHNTSVSSKDIKEISLVENPPSVRISYYIRVEQERTLYFSNIKDAKEFKKHILRSIIAEESQIAHIARKLAIAADILQKIRELLDDNS